MEKIRVEVIDIELSEMLFALCGSCFIRQVSQLWSRHLSAIMEKYYNLNRTFKLLSISGIFAVRTSPK